MKKIILGLVIMLGSATASFSQIKITQATKQKTIAGTGGVYMNYSIEFRGEKNAGIVIDSVKTIADSTVVPFYTDKNRISFQEILLPAAKCKTCVETAPTQQNLTKGVIMYYGKRGEKYKVEKFKHLPDIPKP